MPIIFCPVCNQRVLFQNYDIDVDHTCSTGNEVIDFQDKFNLEQEAWNWAGLHSNNFGRRSWIEGEDVENLTPHGRRESTFRRVPREVFMEVGDKNKIKSAN